MFQTLLCTCLSNNAPCGTTCSHLHRLFVYQRDRAWHVFASCTDCIAGMITVAARHMSFSCTDRETDAPMRSIVSRLGTNVDINSNMNLVLCVRHELMIGFRKLWLTLAGWVCVAMICGPDFDIIICGTSCV